jgi:spermidine/putrescine transport system permease protein
LKNNKVKTSTVLGMIQLIWTLLFFVLPFLILIYASLKEYQYGVQLKGISFLNYTYLFDGSLFYSTLITSLIVSTGATVLIVICSIFIVVLLFNCRNGKAKSGFIYLMATTCILGVIPRTFANSFFLPGVEAGGLLKTVSLYTIGGILLTYFCVYAPLASLILIAFRDKINNDFINVSRELGANKWQVQMQVILPMMKRGIVITSLLTFLLTIGDVTIIDIIGGSKYYTTPLYIIDRIKIDDWGTASAAAMVMISLVIFLLTISIIYLLKDENDG